MELYQTVVELIDLRSFSNLWYWIGLAVLWSTVSHWVMGIPHDMIQRARRSGGSTLADVQALARINVDRILSILELAGIWLAAFAAGTLTVLLVLGFWYDVEFAQAVFMMAFPMTLVGLLSIRTARVMQRSEYDPDRLFLILARHRFWTQLMGVISIFITAVWGMYQNMSIGALG